MFVVEEGPWCPAYPATSHIELPTECIGIPSIHAPGPPVHFSRTEFINRVGELLLFPLFGVIGRLPSSLPSEMLLTHQAHGGAQTFKSVHICKMLDRYYAFNEGAYTIKPNRNHVNKRIQEA